LSPWRSCWLWRCTDAPGIDRVIHQRTLHIGPEEVVVAAKIAVARGATAEDVADAINAAEVKCREAIPDLRLLIYLEPDIERASTTASPTTG
jgi:divalent metal cation (Fe/Co/Zn/Cd) transporter